MGSRRISFSKTISTPTSKAALITTGRFFQFLYITYTGSSINGIPAPWPCDDATATDACEVGRHVRGKSGMATFVFHDGDHPLWKVASRNVIPQPGAYAHFHWLGPPETAFRLVEGDPFDGYFQELKAVKTFYFEHGGDTIPVEPGIDIRTHANVVASFPE